MIPCNSEVTSPAPYKHPPPPPVSSLWGSEKACWHHTFREPDLIQPPCVPNHQPCRELRRGPRKGWRWLEDHGDENKVLLKTAYALAPRDKRQTKKKNQREGRSQKGGGRARAGVAVRS